MQAAGIDSGMTQSATLVSGLQGTWKETSTDYSNITSAGLMAYRVGYDSAMYSVYLRRDGTLPMTGDLNMDGNNIKNVSNLDATGNLTTTGNIYGKEIVASGKVVAGGEIIAHNGYGDEIALGGDDGSDDYELRLGSNKPLSIYSPKAEKYSRVLHVESGNVSINNRLGLMGADPNNVPTGWMGGLTTVDVYANGTLAAGRNGGVSAYMNANGEIFASGNIHSDKTIDANYFLPNSNEVVGTACPTQGLISKESTGAIISCQDGIWRRINYAADAPKPLKIILSCHAGNNSSNSCRKDVYTDLTFWRDGITRPEIKLVSERITRWWGDGCGSCSPGSFSYSNGVILIGVNQAFVEREFTLSW